MSLPHAAFGSTARVVVARGFVPGVVDTFLADLLYTVGPFHKDHELQVLDTLAA